jgi:glycosyltransferase involved in cell wall biosynthesis
VIAGDGPERDRLMERARTRPGAARVRFLGSIPPDELELLYRAADVCVVPSTALEGFGLVVLEALACGAPVIVTDSGGLPEAVDGLDPGLVVARNDPAALRDRLRAALNGSAPLPDADRCRAVAESFDWPSVAARHRAIYAEAAAQPRRRPRILFVDHCAQLSGAEISMLRLLRSFSDVDAHVVLFEDGPLAVRLGSSAITSEILVLPERTRALRRSRTNTLPSPRVLFDAGAQVFKLVRRIRAVRPDVVHANSLKACLIAGVAARLTRVPCIWHVHDRIEPDYLPRRAVALVRFLARRLPTAVVANSHATLASLRLAPEHRPAGVVVSGSVPSEFFAAASPPTPERVPRAAMVVGMVGRLTPWKGQDVFLEAFARAFPDGDVRARVIGDALFDEENYAASLLARARTLRIADRVEFRGFCHDVPAELAALDVLVHASVIPEPFGQVVVEGMAAGLPVIASDAGGPAEVISSELDGLLVAPGDIEGLAAALRRLASDAALRHRLGRAARLRAAEFGSDATASRMEAIYRELIGANA